MKDGTIAPDRLVPPVPLRVLLLLHFCRFEEKTVGRGGVGAIDDETLKTLLLRMYGMLLRRLDLSSSTSSVIVICHHH